MDGAAFCGGFDDERQITVECIPERGKLSATLKNATVNMNETFQVISVLLAALWWGGVAALDLIFIPTIIRTPNVPNDHLVDAYRYVGKLYGYVQLGLGIFLLLMVILGGAELNIIILVVFMLLLAALDSFVIEPVMAVFRRESGGTAVTVRDDEQARLAQHRFRQMQLSYYAVDVFKILFGATLLALLVTA